MIERVRDHLPLILATAAIVANIYNDQHDRPTICSDTRPIIPVPVFAGTLAWFIPHWVGPKLKGQ